MQDSTTIFMVDDDTDLVDVVRAVLEGAGYRFASAGSASEALEVVDGIRPDLVILDVMMEDLLAGFRVVNRLRDFDAFPQSARYREVPILVMSSIQPQVREHFLRDAGSRLLPIDAFVEKPLKPRALLEKVSALLHR